MARAFMNDETQAPESRDFRAMPNFNIDPLTAPFSLSRFGGRFLLPVGARRRFHFAEKRSAYDSSNR
jgi:hypothetical protein